MPAFDTKKWNTILSSSNLKDIPLIIPDRYGKDFDTVRFVPVFEKYRESQNHLVLHIFAHGIVFNNNYDRGNGKRCFKNVVMVSPIQLGIIYHMNTWGVHLLRKKICFELKHRSIQDVVKKLYILHNHIDIHPRTLFNLSFPNIALKQNWFCHNTITMNDRKQQMDRRHNNTPFLSACFYNKIYDFDHLNGYEGLFIATLRNKKENQQDVEINCGKTYDLSQISRNYPFTSGNNNQTKITLYEIIDHFLKKGFQRITVLDYSCSELNDPMRTSIQDEKLPLSPTHFYGGKTQGFND